MARLILFCLVAAGLLSTLATARSFPAAVGTAIAGPPTSGVSPIGSASSTGSAPENAPPVKRRPADRSITCGEVILGGLATAILAAIFCYIRVTRERMGETKS